MGSAMTVATEVKRAAATAKSFIVVGRLVGERREVVFDGV